MHACNGLLASIEDNTILFIWCSHLFVYSLTRPLYMTKRKSCRSAQVVEKYLRCWRSQGDLYELKEAVRTFVKAFKEYDSECLGISTKMDCGR